jgi:hypothetical protein
MKYSVQLVESFSFDAKNCMDARKKLIQQLKDYLLAEEYGYEELDIHVKHEDLEDEYDFS